MVPRYARSADVRSGDTRSGERSSCGVDVDVDVEGKEGDVSVRWRYVHWGLRNVLWKSMWDSFSFGFCLVVLRLRLCGCGGELLASGMGVSVSAAAFAFAFAFGLSNGEFAMVAGLLVFFCAIVILGVFCLVCTPDCRVSRLSFIHSRMCGAQEVVDARNLLAGLTSVSWLTSEKPCFLTFSHFVTFIATENLSDAIIKAILMIVMVKSTYLVH
jgi:hypothetical protein